MRTDWFSGEVAAGYDAGLGTRGSPEVLGPTVDLLADLAGDGPALEFGVGTGRVALPLADRLPVHGIEWSPDMLARLAAKPGAAAVRAVRGDMATTRVPGQFTLVYLVFNTIMNLTTQDAQVDCFANAAAHLRPGGRFVVEVGVPALQKLPTGERFVPFAVGEHHVGVDEYDVVDQRLVSHHLIAREDGSWRRTSPPFRYVWPAELDLMARLAGLALEHRWADWDRSAFTATSTSHVSVWRHP